MLAGGKVLRLATDLFTDWIELLRVVAQHGNASLVAFVRASPRFVLGFFSDQKSTDLNRANEASDRIDRKSPAWMAKLHSLVFVPARASYAP